MSTLQSSSDHLTINADGASKNILFQANGVQKASISSAGLLTSTTIDATVLTGALPAISGASLTGLTASEAEVTTGTSTSVAVTPGTQVFHDLHAKASVTFDVAGNLAQVVNVSGVTDTGTGDWLIAWNPDFDDQNYTAVMGLMSGTTNVHVMSAETQVGATMRITNRLVGTQALTDPASSGGTSAHLMVVAWGDHV